MPAPEKDPTWRAWVDGPPPLNQPPFLLLRLPSLPLPPLVLITVHEGEGAILAGPLCSSRGWRPLVRNSPSSLLSAPSPLLIPYLTRLPSLSAAVVVGRLVPLSTPSNALPRCRSFTAGLPTQFLHVSLPLFCLSVTPLSPLFISW